MVYNTPFKKFLVHRVPYLSKSSLGRWNIERYGFKVGHQCSRLSFVIWKFVPIRVRRRHYHRPSASPSLLLLCSSFPKQSLRRLHHLRLLIFYVYGIPFPLLVHPPHILNPAMLLDRHNMLRCTPQQPDEFPPHSTIRNRL